VSHFVTLTEDCAASGSQSSRIVVQRLEEKFCIMEECIVSVVCLCEHRNKTSSVLTVSIVCTDKQDLLSVNFHLNEFCQIL
jgi:hypothetical protein